MRESRVRWVFAVAALVCGLVYWWFADWWAYVELPDGPMPKFVVPWWGQFIMSSIFGVLAGGLLAGVWYLVWWAMCNRR